MRMSLPCRASTCDHLQCFDASLYIKMNEKKAKWLCPVCNKPALYDNLLLVNIYSICNLFVPCKESCTVTTWILDSMGFRYSNGCHVTWRTIWIPDILNHKQAFSVQFSDPPFEYRTISHPSQKSTIQMPNYSSIQMITVHRKKAFCTAGIQNPTL